LAAEREPLCCGPSPHMVDLACLASRAIELGVSLVHRKN
jgi:hypothetical protein